MVKKQILSIFILFLLVANPAFADELPVEQSYGHLYSLIVSSGNRPDDMDVIVVKNTVREFTQFLTYKHCSSHDANGTPNMISKLRFMRLLKTEEFQSEPQRQDLFKKIFESPSCQFIDKNLYILRYPLSSPGDPNAENHIFMESLTAGSLGIWFWALARESKLEIRRALRTQNTISLFKFIFSKGIGRKMLVGSGVSLGVGGALSYFTAENVSELKSKSLISKSLFYKPDSLVIIPEHISDYAQEMQTGLQLLVRDQVLQAM